MISLQQAQRELQQAAAMNPGPWIAHSQSVAENARLIAQRAGMDEQRACLFGLLHDIGRRAGITGIRHIFDGYDYMTALGQPEVARICLTHSFPLPDIRAFNGRMDCTGEQLAFLQDFLSRNPYDDYDRLIQLCDAISHHKDSDARKAGRQPSKADERFRKRAEELLYGGLSVALGIPQDSVPQYIHQKLKAAGRS